MCAGNGLCLCVWVECPHAMPYMWQSEDNLQVLVLTFPSCLIQTLYCCINQVSWLTNSGSFICLLPFPIACWDHRDLHYHVQLLCRFRGSKCRLKGLTASAFTHGAISPSPEAAFYLFLCISFTELFTDVHQERII